MIFFTFALYFYKMKKFIKKLLQIEFVRHFLTLFTGSTLSQVILFAITPILTRLYSEELFGLYFVFTSIVMVLKTIATLRFELAIVLPKKDEDAINVIFLTILLNIIFCLSVTGLIFLFKDFFNSLLGEKDLGNYLYLIPISVFFTGLNDIFLRWNNRVKKYKNISVGSIIKTSSTGIWSIGWGSFGFKNIGLIPGQIFGVFSSFTFLFFISIKELFKLVKYISLKRVIFLVNKYKNILKYNTLINFLVNISNEAPIFLLANYFGADTVGLYGMANRLIGTPSNLISKSISPVFFQNASDKYNNKEDVYIFLKKTYSNLLKIGLLIFIPALILSPLLQYILGKEWLHTGYYAMIIIPLVFFKFLNNPVSSIFTILNQQKKLIIFYFCILFLRIASIYIGYKVFENPFIAIGLFVLSGIVFNIILIFSFLKMTKSVDYNAK